MTTPAPQRKRTAVLVVHGIGSQRAQETVRGIIRAVWLDDEANRGSKKVWVHPEVSGIDLDLAVMTTSSVQTSRDKRNVDFHELYWAHLMSETKAVAVLLWLFELARKGPYLKPGMNGLWWCGAIFLCLLLVSVALLALQAVAWLSEIDKAAPESMLVAPVLMVFSSVLFGLWIALRHRALRLAAWLGWICVAGLVAIVSYLAVERFAPGTADLLTNVSLPILVALLSTYLLMGEQGLRAFWRVLFVSALVFIVFLVSKWMELSNLTVAGIVGQFSDSGGRPWSLESWTNLSGPDVTLARVFSEGWRPWTLSSPWSSVVAWVIIGLYLIANAAFLQPYLGDAARYFRNAPANVAVRREIRKQSVDTLAALHTSGLYDRIVVVAHSLGSVVAYDMLRAYFSRVSDELPPTEQLGPSFAEVDNAPWEPFRAATKDDRRQLRTRARTIIASIADVTAKDASGRTKSKSWRVTDFVTVGAALTHAHYLMCAGKNDVDLEKDFERRVNERDFPTCPPKRLDDDGLLSFLNPSTGRREFHHGAMFGLTRWTNLYFPLHQIFWGDAIGGPVAPVFGSHVVDVRVSTHATGDADFFTHNTYWDVEREGGRNAPHVQALRKAIDLADAETAIELSDDGAAGRAS
jgi:hypothetical protein